MRIVVTLRNELGNLWISEEDIQNYRAEGFSEDEIAQQIVELCMEDLPDFADGGDWKVEVMG